MKKTIISVADDIPIRIDGMSKKDAFKEVLCAAIVAELLEQITDVSHNQAQSIANNILMQIESALNIIVRQG